MVECYDPSTPSLKFVKEVYLYKNEEYEPFIKNSNSIDFIKDSSFATNGQTLLLQTNNGAYFFDLKTGIRQQKVKLSNYDASNTVMTFDYQNNLFY